MEHALWGDWGCYWSLRNGACAVGRLIQHVKQLTEFLPMELLIFLDPGGRNNVKSRKPIRLIIKRGKENIGGFPNFVNMSTQEEFDIEKVHDLFTKCRREDGSIGLDAYVNAYEELCRFFHLLGTVFGFVTSDVKEKIGILRDYRKSDEASHYETVMGMINYEVENNLTKKKRKHLSGSRTLLRLHRAMEFVTEFMKGVSTMDQSKKLTTVGSDSYHRTLAQHHPWLIRKAVGVAMYTLPVGHSLTSKMGNHDLEKTLKLITEVTCLTQPIYDHIQSLYAKNNLLDLP